MPMHYPHLPHGPPRSGPVTGAITGALYTATATSVCAAMVTASGSGSERHELPTDGTAGSATVAQSRRDTVDRDQQGALHAVVRVARAQAPQELDLQVVERVDVRAPVADRASKGGIALQQSFGALDSEQVAHRKRLL